MQHKVFLILSSAILFPTLMLGLTKRSYTITFGEGDFTYETANGLVQIVPHRGDAIIWGDSLSPALPGIIVNMLIAPNEEYISMSSNSNEFQIMEDVIIEPNPALIPTNIHDAPTNVRRVSYSKSEYPNSYVEYTGTHISDGYKYLSFVVSPYRYDAVGKNLYLNKSIKLEVHTSRVAKLIKSNYTSPGRNMRDAIKELVVNVDELDKLYEKTPTTLKSSGIDSYEYIIVTCDSLKPIFEKLAWWKTIKGVRSKVITVECCQRAHPNDSQQLAIQKELAGYYSNGMTYTMLAGDTYIVPTQMCAIPSPTDDSPNTPCDLYFACLDNDLTWDYNGNHIYGEMGDHCDFYPEFFITRTSVASQLDAKVFVDRIIGYESASKLEGWTKTMLSCGSLIYGYTTKNDVQISDAQWRGEHVYENGVQPYWNGTLFELFDTYTDHPNGANYAANAEHLQTELEKGYIFVDEYSHGWINGWGRLEGSTLYGIDYASALMNIGCTVITSTACHTNAFDRNLNDTICLSEAFMRNPNSGVLAYYASAREGYLDYSYQINEKFYDYLLSGKDKQFGRAATLAKKYIWGSVYRSVYHRLEMTIHGLGDPEMPIFTDSIRKFENVVVNYQNGNLTVNTGVDSCRICVSSVADNGATYYEVTDNVSQGSYSGINNDCFLCITKTGYKPFVARIGPLVFLQDETFARDVAIFSDNTYAGSDVTTEKPQGPVSIVRGKVTNKSKNEIILKNDFEVKLGAELEIEVNP